MKKTSLEMMCIAAVLFIFAGSAWCEEGTTETYYGTGAGHDHDHGTRYGTFIGANAGYKNTTGMYNTAVGVNAGKDNTAGERNTAVGVNAGPSNTASDNTFIGLEAGYLNSSGEKNTFVGSGARRANSTSVGNTFLGYGSGYSTTNGVGVNTFLGCNAGHENVSGLKNVYVGTASGYNSTGSGNVFLGYGAGNYSPGSYNVFLGSEAGSNESGSNKLYIANSDTSTPLIWGDFSAGEVKINGKFYIASDRRFKKNIEPLQTALDKILHLKGVSYEWKEKSGVGKGRDIGFIAQDVESVLPELVHTDNNGYKSVAYDKITPVLVEAIKEQQKALEEQQAINKDLAEQMALLRAEINKLRSSDMTAQKKAQGSKDAL